MIFFPLTETTEITEFFVFSVHSVGSVRDLMAEVRNKPFFVVDTHGFTPVALQRHLLNLRHSPMGLRPWSSVNF